MQILYFHLLNIIIKMSRNHNGQHLHICESLGSRGISESMNSQVLCILRKTRERERERERECRYTIK
jgi:hypothetical protein